MAPRQHRNDAASAVQTLIIVIFGVGVRLGSDAVRRSVRPFCRDLVAAQLHFKEGSHMPGLTATLLAMSPYLAFAVRS